MANPIEPANVVATRFVTPTSRYAEAIVIRYGETKKLTFETYKRGDYTPSPADKYTVVTKGYEYRPDLLSRKMYGTVDFWWKIMEANGIADIYDFKAGLNIRLPTNIF